MRIACPPDRRNAVQQGAEDDRAAERDERRVRRLAAREQLRRELRAEVRAGRDPRRARTRRRRARGAARSAPPPRSPPAAIQSTCVKAASRRGRRRARAGTSPGSRRDGRRCSARTPSRARGRRARRRARAAPRRARGRHAGSRGSGRSRATRTRRWTCASSRVQASRATSPRSARPALGLVEQRRRDPPPLVVGMDGEVPDHPPCPADRRAPVELALEIDEADDLAIRPRRRARSPVARTLLLPPTSSKKAEPRNESTRQRSQPISSAGSYGRIVTTSATLLRLPATLSVAPGGVVQLVRTPACHAGGRGFESRRSRLYLQGFRFRW